jgi:hypothetical protein
LLRLAIASAVLAGAAQAAPPSGVIIGASVYGETFISKADQDAELLRLAANGV